jgi:DNA-binding CsgD family transcriptional regulator
MNTLMTPPLDALTSLLESDNALGAGLVQLDRYLSRCWGRAGIPACRHDDCDQAVYLRLLERFGRDRLDHLLAAAGRQGIRAVLGRETACGPAFFRAVDAVKKRVSRERNVAGLEATAMFPASDRGTATAARRAALQDTIERSLGPRQAALIRATMCGETPAEIAGRLGLTAKTISNEKALAIRKLRLALAGHGDS